MKTPAATNGDSAAISGHPAAINGHHSAMNGNPAARKIYVTGSRPDLRVPVREITLADPNPPVHLYDTSGPPENYAVALHDII